METLFIKVLNQSIAAGWLVIAVILVRAILKKSPKWLSCTLWGIVALRLILPFSLESVFSLIPSSTTVPETIMYSDTPQIDSGIGLIDKAIDPFITKSLSPNIYESANPMQIVAFFAALIWMLGTAVMIGYMIFSCIFLKLRLRTAVKLYQNIYQSEKIAAPFVFGFINSRIYLPYNIKSEDLKYVLLHEQMHIKRMDHIIKPLAFILLSVFWFNPLIWIAYILFCRDTELACDERVIKSMNTDNKSLYSTALLNCSVHREKAGACPLAFSETGIKTRIKNILNYKKPALWQAALAIVLCIIVSLCFLTNPRKHTDILNVYQVSTENSDVKFKIKKAEIKNNELIITAEWINNSKESIEFGEAFEISRISDDAITKCSENAGSAWELPLYTLFSGGKTQMKYNLSSHYSISSPGRYRFETSFNFDNSRKEKNTVSVDFEIKDGITKPDVKKIYTYTASTDIVKPKLTLKNDGKFEFFYSVLSSYYAVGTYSINENILTCKTDDNNYTYTFRIYKDKLIFDESLSSDIPDWNFSSGDKNNPEPCVPDNAVFS